MASPDQPMASAPAASRPRQRLGVRDLVTIGMLSAIALVISTVVGMICATTIIGAFLYIAVAAFFVAIVFLLGAVRIRKPGTIFLMGTIVSLLGMMSGNVVGVAGCVAGWLVADAIAGRYASRGRIIAAYVVGSALQFVGFMLPIFLSAGDYLAARKDLFHLSDEAIQEYLGYVSWPVFAGATALVAVLSLAGALVAARIIRRHFVKAGLVR
ncbi:MptD family putative ECF transporter S component [Actinomyces israelii]|uniref:MptD family putative ECF transporter S component n=1 Tax=Actinomyces israelii TaxID=1659 RepID=UPI0009FC718F|nr:MptD family putative ECF transporter S component [Actinomyces israelii]